MPLGTKRIGNRLTHSWLKHILTYIITMEYLTCGRIGLEAEVFSFIYHRLTSDTETGVPY